MTEVSPVGYVTKSEHESRIQAQEVVIKERNQELSECHSTIERLRRDVTELSRAYGDLRHKDVLRDKEHDELLKRAEYAEGEIGNTYDRCARSMELRIAEVRKLQKRLHGWRKKKAALREEIQYLTNKHAEDMAFCLKHTTVKAPAVTEQVYAFAIDTINLLNNTCPAKSAEAVTLLQTKVQKLPQTLRA